MQTDLADGGPDALTVSIRLLPGKLYASGISVVKHYTPSLVLPYHCYRATGAPVCWPLHLLLSPYLPLSLPVYILEGRKGGQDDECELDMWEDVW